MKKSGINTSIIHKFVLFIAAISTTFSVSAYDFEVDGIYYDKISDTSVEVTHDENLFDDNGAGYSGNVAIPETIGINGATYFVRGIGRYAFHRCVGLTSVTIPEGVTSIGDFAFSGCTGLTEIEVNENNPKYASNDGVLFNKAYTELILCPAGKAGIYNIPEGVTSIGVFAFVDCTGLTSVTIPASVTSIGDGAFSGCTSLISVFVPEGVTSIGGGVFSGCNDLISVNISASVTSIGSGTFSDCPGLTEIVINDNNQNYASNDGVLYNKTYTELILCPAGKTGIYNIPDGVISIDYGAFYGCTGLTSVTIPASVTSIGESAFSDCFSLTSVTIPASVTSIGEGVFSGCTGLTSVTIPAGVKSIDNYAFYGCTSLTSVTIPASVTSIGESAFRNCIGLTYVNIQVGVASIGRSAFRGCSGLTSVGIPEGVTSIGQSAFRGCTSLVSVSVSASVASIGEDAFRDCSNLTEIKINENNPNYASNDGVLFNKTYTELILCPAGKAGIYNIPEGVTLIGSFAFEVCSGLTSVAIPASVTSINIGAFYGCSGLTSVTIPASVSTIGERTFRDCTNLTSVYIPASVISISEDAFRGCTGLTSVTIPAYVTSIGRRSFYGCMALNKVICFAETVPTFGYEVFAGVPTTCSVYVLSGTKDSYVSADELASFTIKEFGLTVSPAELTLEVGATAELTASYTVDGAAETETEFSSVLGSEFIWSSSAENVATVSNSGQVTARNVGTAEIKVVTCYGNTVFATSAVNVGTSGILDVTADGIEIRATPGKILLENIGENQKVSAFTIDGICQIIQVSNDGTVEIPAETGKIYIIVVDGFATKVLAK